MSPVKTPVVGSALPVLSSWVAKVAAEPSFARIALLVKSLVLEARMRGVVARDWNRTWLVVASSTYAPEERAACRIADASWDPTAVWAWAAAAGASIAARAAARASRRTV